MSAAHAQGAGRATESLEDALAACANLDDDGERLACFDALAGAIAPRSQPERTPAPETRPTAEAARAAPAVPEAGTAARPLTDDVGRGQVRGDDRPEEQEEIYTAALVRCEKAGPSGRTFFFLANGQIWRESNVSRLRLGNCEGDVRISRDAFGYKLYVAAEDRTFRVRRAR